MKKCGITARIKPNDVTLYHDSICVGIIDSNEHTVMSDKSFEQHRIMLYRNVKRQVLTGDERIVAYENVRDFVGTICVDEYTDESKR